jgi:fructosamine-3-kinase
VGDSDRFVKRRIHAPAGFFEAEAAGLAWLSAGGARAVSVYAVDDSHIELERLRPSAPARSAAARLGAQLAAMHAAGARYFGCPPDGYTGPMYIGNRPMPSGRHESWGTFYMQDRVLPFLEIAVAAGSVTAAQRPDIDAACDLIAAGAFNDNEPPARLHGDLWSGNVIWTVDGAVLIDPAAHGGHRETDLAMLDLFGCPYLDVILDAYQAVHPLRPGWRQRIPLHQLHPLAVHAAGYGPSYGQALHRAALRTRDLV